MTYFQRIYAVNTHKTEINPDSDKKQTSKFTYAKCSVQVNIGLRLFFFMLNSAEHEIFPADKR